MSDLVEQGKSTAVTSASSSYSYSSSTSSSSSSSSSSSTKVVKQSSTTVKSSSSVSSSSASSKNVGITSSGQSYSDRVASDHGLDMGKEVEKLKLKMNEEMANIHQDMFQLMPISSPDAEKHVVLNSDSLKSCIDKTHGDRLKLNFDVNEFESESINIKTVGNKIEVHAKKKSKKGDEERNEEFSRVYELPTANAVDAGNVTSSIYKDGVLTIELPVADAIAGTNVSLDP